MHPQAQIIAPKYYEVCYNPKKSIYHRALWFTVYGTIDILTKEKHYEY